jgi:hypothetical protein
VVVSQNELHGIHAYLQGYPGPKLYGSDGTCVVLHEDHNTETFPYPVRIWYLFNEVYDSDAAFRIQTSDEVYIIGNVVHDIISSYDLLEDSGYSTGSVLQMWDEKHVSFINNTSYNTDLGILAADYNPGAYLYIYNNIISNLSDTHYTMFGTIGHHIYVDQAAVAERSEFFNNHLYQNGNAVKIRWSDFPADLPVYPSMDDNNNFRGAPVFVDTDNDNYDIQSSSPAIDNATSSGTVQSAFNYFYSLYGLSIAVDYDGNSRSGSWDIGAYEYGEGGGGETKYILFYP